MVTRSFSCVLSSWRSRVSYRPIEKRQEKRKEKSSAFKRKPETLSSGVFQRAREASGTQEVFYTLSILLCGIPWFNFTSSLQISSLWNNVCVDNLKTALLEATAIPLADVETSEGWILVISKCGIIMWLQHTSISLALLGSSSKENWLRLPRRPFICNRKTCVLLLARKTIFLSSVN